MGGGRFTSTIDELTGAGILAADLVPMIPPCGQKSFHTPLGRIDVKQMAGNRWRVEYDGKVMSHVATCAILEQFDAKPKDDTEIEWFPDHCFRAEFEWAYDHR